MSPCSCHEPLVFGHRCLEEPTGDMWPGNDTPTIDDMAALLRRTADVQVLLDELEQATSAAHQFIQAKCAPRDTYSWLDMIKSMRKSRR